jgi:polyphosphate:AMP phosphotransferase
MREEFILNLMAYTSTKYDQGGHYFMLRHFDFKSTGKQVEASSKELRIELARLQRRCIEKKIPVLIIVDGWDTSGKGLVLNKICQDLDPRYYSVCLFDRLSDDVKSHPFLWQFWEKLPKKGHISIFDRSFYYHLLDNYRHTDCDLTNDLNDLYKFERTLVDDGTIIIKLFLHITKKTQRNRMKLIEESNIVNLLSTFIDYDQLKKHNEYLEIFNQILERSDYFFSHWHVINMEYKSGLKTALMAVIGDLQRGIDGGIKEILSTEGDVLSIQHVIPTDLDKPITKKEYVEKMPLLQKKVTILTYMLHREGISTVIAFEGVDAAGKGGAIKRLTEHVDARIYDIHTTAAPSNEESLYHYLRRFATAMPSKGRMTIFDRTWYGRVLVERVEGFATVAEWRRAYREISAMENHLLHNGVNLIKFFLIIDKDEQLKRFNERQNNPEKRYKITPDDWHNREKWDAYYGAYEEMIYRTSTAAAPWTIIEANNKLYARMKVLETYIKESIDQLEIQARRKNKKIDWEKIFQEK